MEYEKKEYDPELNECCCCSGYSKNEDVYENQLIAMKNYMSALFKAMNENYKCSENNNSCCCSECNHNVKTRKFENIYFYDEF